MDWFREELIEVQESGRINLTVYITRPGQIRRNAVAEKDGDDLALKESHNSYDDFPSIQQENGKPDIKVHLNHMVTTAEKSDRIIVSCCGPADLMQEVRNTVAESISLSGPSITLQNEQFGW